MHALLVTVVVWVAATPLPPRTDRLIYDTAQVIDDATEAALEQRHRELAAKAQVAIVIVTVPRLVDETIDELAVRVGQSWGVGRKGQDRGLVVALARDDRRIFVATGYGTEGYLPDGRVGAMLDEHAIPFLRQNRPSEALERLSAALVAASAREYEVTITGATEPRAPARDPPSAWSMILIALAIIGFALLAWRHPALALLLLMGMGRGRGGGGFGGGSGFGGFGGGGFGGGGAGRGY